MWLVVGIALALPAGLWILQVNMDEMSAEWQGRPGLSVYFAADASSEDIELAAMALREHAGAEDVTVTTASEALEEFKAYSGLGDALELLGENPLPASRAMFFPQPHQPHPAAAQYSPSVHPPQPGPHTE